MRSSSTIEVGGLWEDLVYSDGRKIHLVLAVDETWATLLDLESGSILYGSVDSMDRRVDWKLL